MGRIRVPTFLVGSFQDEQTGGHFATASTARGNPRTWLNLQNGVHADSLGPSYDHPLGRVPPALRRRRGAARARSGPRPQQRALHLPRRRAGRARPAVALRRRHRRRRRARRVRARPARAADDGQRRRPGRPRLDRRGVGARLRRVADPPRPRRPTSSSARAARSRPRRPPRAPPSTSPIPARGPATTLPGEGEADAWKAQPPYDWAPLADGKGVGFATPPLPSDVVIAGGSSLSLRLSASAGDTDLQVTLSEIRPDGRETYVQNGWLRASHRNGHAPRRALEPIPRAEGRATATVPDRPRRARVPRRLAHPRHGRGARRRPAALALRLRRRRLDARDGPPRAVAARPSRCLQGVTAPTPLPAPTALRGQPSRAYVPAANGG